MFIISCALSMDHYYYYYYYYMIVLLQGKKLWTVYLPAAITTMDVMHHRLKGFKALLYDCVVTG